MFPQFHENLLNGIDVGLTWRLNIDEEIIQINNDKNTKHFGQDFIDITLEASRYIGEPKRHYLVLRVAVSSPKERLSFIALFYSNSMASTCKIELGKSFGLT